MITKRLATLQVILLGGLGAVALLPKDIRIQPSAVNLSLPEWVGDWKGEDQEIGKSEREILGPDTQFARKIYKMGQDEIAVSIVLSGPDMNTSIHRPERCLPAQGWTVVQSDRVSIPVGRDALDATRLQNLYSAPIGNGQHVSRRNLTFYWFVGHSDMTASHFERTWIDIRDRVLRGQNQQWAYVTVAAGISKDYLPAFGRDEKQTSEMIQKFVAELMPQLQKERFATVD